jgi:hypothetical protein
MTLIQLFAAAVLLLMPAQQHDHAMMHRGQQAMGFDQTKATHHFLLQTTGGTIQITANDQADSDTTARVREHLQHIRGAFASGDFALPHFIHAGDPPGTAVLKARRDRLTYRYEELPLGGRLVVTTEDREALSALHEFLKYQITEHRTGDPLQPK